MAKLIEFVIVLIGIFATASCSDDKTPFELKEFLTGTFFSRGWNGSWISENSILYESEEDEHFYTFEISNKKKNKFLDGNVLEDYGDATFSVSPNNEFILIRYNVKSVFRHSTTAQYAVHKIGSKNYYKIEESKDIQLCEWTPAKSELIYVYENNIYHLKTVNDPTKKRQITKDGKDGIYNGIPDWVYEEEVLSSGSAIWVSPDGNHLAFARFDDDLVKKFQFPVYGEPGTMNSQYPHIETVRYPKAGQDNPSVELKHVVLNSDTIEIKAIPLELNGVTDVVLQDVSVTNEEIYVLLMNRIQNQAVLKKCNIGNNKCDSKPIEYKEENGWLNLQMPQHCSAGLLQILPMDGYYHLTLRDNANEVKKLSTGNKTITAIYGVSKTGVVFYEGTLEKDHAQQHMYSLDLKTEKETCITCSVSTPNGKKCRYSKSYFSTDFSHVTIACAGPGPMYVVVQKLFTTTEFIWESNVDLRKQLDKKLIPEIEDSSVELESGHKAAVRLLLPPNLDPTKKYPLIVNVYAGPNSNMINDGFSIGFHTYLVTNREYIYAYIDGRGSGKRGTDLMFQVYKKLGTVEIEDQIAVTRALQEKYSFIDVERTGIWGWSYGGFATAWAMVKDINHVFKCGISVAPVTNFIYYDSVYTERYMDIPNNNEVGYNNTDVTIQPNGFRDKEYFLIHGNADDNVHFQQSMILARALELADVPFTQMSYPDEAHSLAGVHPHLYHAMDKFWAENFAGYPTYSNAPRAANTAMLLMIFTTILCLVKY